MIPRRKIIVDVLTDLPTYAYGLVDGLVDDQVHDQLTRQLARSSQGFPPDCRCLVQKAGVMMFEVIEIGEQKDL